MFLQKSKLQKNKKNRLALLSLALIPNLLVLSLVTDISALASPGGIQFQWDPDPDFQRLKAYQSSNKRMQRAFYWFFLRSRNRKTGILKLTIKVPDYFKANILEKNLNLCLAEIGGFASRTKCKADIPAIFEISENQAEIVVYPDKPIPVDKKTYAVVMKVKNPRRPAMFQFHGFAQSSGAVPMSSYIGTWSFDVD